MPCKISEGEAADGCAPCHPRLTLAALAKGKNEAAATTEDILSNRPWNDRPRMDQRRYLALTRGSYAPHC